VKDLLGLMGKMQEMQAKMAAMKDEIAAITADGSSGAGLVRVSVNAKGEIASLKIDPSLFKEDSVEILEDLIMAAHADGAAKAAAQAEAKMREITADLPLPPGMKLPF
jgi:hypothetical protein